MNRAKIISLLLVFFLFMSCCYAQVAKKDSFNPLSLYPYNGHYINLDNLKVINTELKTETTFKSLGKYAGRYSFPYWFSGYPKTALYKTYKFELMDDRSIKITGLPSGREIAIVKKDNDLVPENESISSFLASTSHGVVMVKKTEGKAGYTVSKYNESGDELFRVNFAHTYIDAGVYAQTSYPYLDYFKHTDHDMVFTSYDRHYPKTQIVDLTTGKLTSYDFIVNGIIRQENEESVIGFISIDEDNQTIKVKCPPYEWTTTMDNNYYDRAETLLSDSTLVIATWPNIATGSALAAYNLHTGKLLWKADVRQLNVGHSKYYNSVTLGAYKDKVIMEGTEAYGSYLQIFNISNGKRLYDEGIN